MVAASNAGLRRSPKVTIGVIRRGGRGPFHSRFQGAVMRRGGGDGAVACGTGGETLDDGEEVVSGGTGKIGCRCTATTPSPRSSSESSVAQNLPIPLDRIFDEYASASSMDLVNKDLASP